MRTHVGLVVGSLLLTVWVVQLYLIFAAYQDYSTRETIRNGWEVKERSSLWDNDINQIANSLGPSGSGGKDAWCTNCGGVGQAACDPLCYRHVGAIEPGVVVPRGTSVTNVDACMALCGRQKDCQAFEHDSVTSACFTYALSSYPPTSKDTGLDSVSSGFAVDTIVPVRLKRQFASTLVFAVPIMLLYVSYNNYFYPTPDMSVAWSTGLPLLGSIFTFAFLQLVGFGEETPMVQFECNAMMNQVCRADGITGGRRSGTCYNGCCGATVSCLDKEDVWTTCTWPNVVCDSGQCALTAKDCGSGGVATKNCTTTGGAKASNGGDYTGQGPTNNNPCYVGDADNSRFPGDSQILAGEPYPDVVGGTQYAGEPNCDVPSLVQRQTGMRCLPPGRLENPETMGGTSNLLMYAFQRFAMTGPLRAFMTTTTTSGKKPNAGCGMRRNPAKGGQEELFLNPSPSSLQCVVPSK